MCVCNCIYTETPEIPAQAAPAKPRLFQWMTVLLLIGWVLVVGVAAKNAQVKDAPASLETFIEELLS